MIERGSMKAIQRIILITLVVTMIKHLIRLKICNETFCCYPLSIYKAHILILTLLYSVM